MTLRNSPLAIDGALIDSATLRIGMFSATGDDEGVTTGPGLKVRPLTTPGAGVRIAHGAGRVLNRYLANPDQIYVVSNNGEQIVDSSNPFWPAVAGADRSHLVGIAVGDPEFTAEGHPFMTSDDPPEGEEATFQYVRPVIIQNVPPSTTSADDLSLTFPFLALARLDIPSGATTITSGMIVDVRNLPDPRSMVLVETFQNGSTDNELNGADGEPGDYEQWPNTAYVDVAVPSWAKVLKVMGYVEGIKLTKAGSGTIRVAFQAGGATTVTNWNESTPDPSPDRKSYNVGGRIVLDDAYPGTNRRIRIEATPATTGSKGALVGDAVTSALLQLRFEEALS